MKSRSILVTATAGLLLLFACLQFRPNLPENQQDSESVAHTAVLLSLAAPAPDSSPTNAPEDPGDMEARAVDSFAQWLEQRKARLATGAAATESPEELTEAIRLATSRRAVMKRWVREDPRRALEHALKWHEWLALPPALRDRVEEPFSETANLRVLADCRPLAARQEPWQTHQVEMRGDSCAAFVYGRRQEATTKLGVPLQGIRLGNDVALWESPARQLEGEEARAAREILAQGNTRDHSWLTGLPIAGDPTAAAIGGRIHYFASEEELQTVQDILAEAERRPGPHVVAKAMAALEKNPGAERFDADAFGAAAFAAASAWTESPKTVLCLRLDVSPARGTPYTEEELWSRMADSSAMIRAMSYGKTWLIPTVTPTVLMLPGSSYSDGVALANDARPLARAAGFNPASYDLIIYTFPDLPMGWAGLSTFDQNLWINGVQDAGVITHECGHAFGLYHANFWLGLSGSGFLPRRNMDGSLMEHIEYGDIYDAMGGGYSAPDGTPYFPNNHFSMYNKARLNWIEPGEVADITSDGIYRVYRFDHPNARQLIGNKLALKIHGAESEELWVGYRRSILNNPASTNAAYVGWATANTLRLLDTTPLSRAHAYYDVDNEDAGLAPAQSYTDPSGSIRITNLRAAGTPPYEYLDIQVEFLDRTAPVYELFTDTSRATPGLRGSYVNRSLRTYVAQDDWRATQTIAGTRVDRRVHFTGNGWGARSAVGLTHGSDDNWEDFSVQWDGVIVVHRPVLLATKSDDSSRMWIDLDGNGAFASAGAEFLNNNWGHSQPATESQVSATLRPGTYRVRIQFQEDNADNAFSIGSTELAFEFFTSASGTTPGLVGSYVNRSLRGYPAQADWRTTQPVSGTRIDSPPDFTSQGWGPRAPLGLSGGAGDNSWDNFSVQWDGYVRIYKPSRLATMSDDGSRFWIDLNGDGTFASGTPEFLDNEWGTAHGVRIGSVSSLLAPGLFRMRAQYEEGEILNLFLLSGAPSATGSTASLVVQNLNDAGPGSLREAIHAANLLQGDRTVTFATALSGGTIRLSSGQLNLIKPSTGTVTITSVPLPAGITISGEHAQRVFKVWPGTRVVLDTLTISNGLASTAAGPLGSGGGGVHSEGFLTIRRCTFVDNSVVAATASAFGGALEQLSGTALIENSTFHRNTVDGSSGFGGALDITAGPVTIRHSTFTGNRLIRTTGTQKGSDLSVYGSTAQLLIGHTIVAANPPSLRPNISRDAGMIVSEGYNLIGDATGTAGWGTHDLAGTTASPQNPWLAPLKNSGGPTAVCLPMGGSPALDAGDPLFVAANAVDQRGYPRVAGGRLDLGAVENCLRALYTFDLQTAEDETEASTAAYHGGGAVWRTDHFNQAYSAFDVLPSYADGYRLQTLPHPGNAARDLGLQGSFTVSAWINSRVVDGDKMVLGSTGPGANGTLHLGLRNGRAHFGFWNNDLPGTRSILPNRWTHLAWVYQAQGQSMAIYVNGQLDASTLPRPNTTRDADVFIGVCEGLPNSYFNGQIDDVAIYCDALAPNQIAALSTDTARPDGILPVPSLPLTAPEPCLWSVTEIFNHITLPNDLVSAEFVASTPALGSTLHYQAPSIHRKDPENPGWASLFPGALPFASNNRTATGLLAGDDDYFVLAARTTIHIAEEDDYTFAFRSDDGARLSVRGAIFASSISPYGGNPATPPHRRDTLSSPGNISLSETYGVTHLHAGEYEVEFLTWEAAGAAFCEVYAARGAKTSFDPSFHLLNPWSLSPARMSIVRSESSMTISWSPGSACQRLQCAPTVLGPWTDCANQANPQSLPSSPSQPGQYFRVGQ